MINPFRLNLNHNKLIRFPEAFFDLRNLRSLTACHNGLSELGQHLGRLDLLEQVRSLAHALFCVLNISVGTSFALLADSALLFLTNLICLKMSQMFLI